MKHTQRTHGEEGRQHELQCLSCKLCSGSRITSHHTTTGRDAQASLRSSTNVISVTSVF